MAPDTEGSALAIAKIAKKEFKEYMMAEKNV
jgi:hypothetical protein